MLAVHQFFHVFTPYLSSLRPDLDGEEAALWVERLLRGTTVLLVSVPIGAFTLADRIIPWLLGDAFLPAVDNVRVLSLCLLALPPLFASSLLALAVKKPRILLSAAGVRLGVFWAAAVPLALEAGSLGACVAVLAATAASGAFAMWKTRAVIPCPLGKWLLTLLVAVPPVTLSAAGPAGVPGIAMWAALFGAYLCVVAFTGLITPREMKELAIHLRR